LGREDVVLVHPKTASTASSSTGALVAAGSLQPWQIMLCRFRWTLPDTNLRVSYTHVPLFVPLPLAYANTGKEQRGIGILGIQ
jgi:hypothetical protein